MEYPRLKKEDDKRFTITDEQVKEMKRLRNLGFSYQKIADMIGVAKTSVAIYCDKERKERMLKQRAEKDFLRWRNDPEYKKFMQERKKKSIDERRKWDEEIIKYNKFICIRNYYKKLLSKSEEMLKYLDN